MPESLAYLRPLFVEEQSARQWLGWIRIALLVYGIVATAVLLGALYFLRNRMSLSSAGLLVGALGLTLCASIFPMQLKSMTLLEPEMLRLRLQIGAFPIWRRNIPIATMTSVELLHRKFQRSALQLDLHNVYFMTQSTNVCITIRDEKRKVHVGSRQAEELAALIQQAIGEPENQV
jgi:hypothetical protein